MQTPAASGSASHNTTQDTRWQALFRAGGLAALLTAVLIPLQVVVFVVWPPPLQDPAATWFALFQDSKLIGLLSLDLLLLVDYVLLIPIVLALYVALRRADQSLMLIGVGLFFIAICAYFASNTAVEMMSLSDRHAAAPTDAQKALLLAAGEAMLATYQGTAFHMSYILGSAAGIAISYVMLRSGIFGRVAAYAGIVGNLVGFGLYLPVVGIVFGVVSGPILWIWYILLARKLLQLSRMGAPSSFM